MRPFKIFTVAFALLFALAHVTHAQAAAPAGQRFSVVVEGTGPDVILIPGLSSPRSVWNAAAERLKARYRVHLVQIGGFAGEPVGANGEGPVAAPVAEALNDYIAKQGLKAPAVIGHSMGGEIAVMLAARHPGSVGRVMAVDSLPFYSLLFSPSATPEGVRLQADMFRDMILGQTVEQNRSAQAAILQRLVKTEAARPALIEAGIASDKSVTARSVHELMTTDLRPELSTITAPLTVLYAWDAGLGLPAEAADRLFRGAYAGAPAARLQRVDGSYHFIMIDQPEAFATAVDNFLR
jgi:pimeloyl-ACP methyl ester carboxylesterase